jgi:hypothetical protein
VRHTWAWMLLCGDDRRNSAKQVIERKESLVELSVRNNKVNQHW